MTSSSTDIKWERRDAFADALRAAIAARGVSLEWLQQRLTERETPVSLATLSYWRSGRSQPEHATSMSAVGTLEELLEVPRGHLRGLVPPSRRPGPLPTYPQSQIHMPPDVTVAQSALGFPVLDRLIDTTCHVIIDVDEEGWEHQLTTRTLWRARRDGDHRFPVVLTIDEPKDTPAQIEALSGCRPGRSYVSEDQSLYAWEMHVDAKLLTGETAVTETRIKLPQGGSGPDLCYEHTAIWRMSELMVWVRFAPTKVPRVATAYTVVDGIEHTRRILLDGAHAVHQVQRGWGPGRLGIRWTFD